MAQQSISVHIGKRRMKALDDILEGMRKETDPKVAHFMRFNIHNLVKKDVLKAIDMLIVRHEQSDEVDEVYKEPLIEPAEPAEPAGSGSNWKF